MRFLLVNALFVGLGEAIRSQYVPGAYLVEFQDNSDIQAFSTILKFNQLGVTPRVTISSDVFNGASYQFDLAELGEDPLQLLSSLPAVKNVWPVETIARPADEIHWAGSNPENIPADIKNGIALNTTSYTPHVLTQVDKLHAEGLTGKGIRIGVVDDGVDYKHPTLGGGFGPGFTVVRGYDHVGDNFTSSREVGPVPDPDPYADCDGHGTHVTGIIAAQANPHGFLGAAPRAEIGMYRVFSCFGETTSDVVAAGITKAYEDGNHIITASLGKRSGWSEDPLAVLSERISRKGVILTFAQGNSGFSGPFMAESPGTGKGTTAVASTDNTEIPRVLLNATYSTNGTGDKPFGWTYGYPDEWGNVSLPLYVGDYESTEANRTCDEFSKAGNLSNQIVLIRAVSWCSDYQKSNYAAAKGATYALFYYNNTNATEIAHHPAPQPKAIGWLPALTAADFVRLDKAGQKLILHMTDPKYAQQYIDSMIDIRGGLMSSYSSWGPTSELDLKPDIAAPGGHILSTWPGALGKYAVISGTSMATPLVAGIYALLLEARGQLKGDELRSLLATTSKPLAQFGRGNLTDLFPTPQQGSGIVQAWDAVHASGIPSVSKLILNDTDHFERYHDFTILNTGSQEVTYALSSQAAPSFYALNLGANSPPTSSQLQQFRQYADIMFSDTKVTVGPGKEAKITILVSAPGAMNSTRLPVYSGFVYLEGSNGERLSLPYVGVVGSMRKATVLQDIYLSRNDVDVPSPVAPGTVFVLPKNPNTTIPDPGTNETTRYILPAVIANLPLSTASLDVEIYSVRNSNGTRGALDKSFGSVPEFPVGYLPRTSQWGAEWNGTLKDGSRAPAGNYTMIGRALRIFGDRERIEDYDVLRTIDFAISYE